MILIIFRNSIWNVRFDDFFDDLLFLSYTIYKLMFIFHLLPVTSKEEFAVDSGEAEYVLNAL